jgi:hypothetical protein
VTTKVPELLKIENTLYEDFRRCAVQVCNKRVSEDDWDWDSYFSMQHHNAPTDGALMALHFAVRQKAKDDASDALVYVMESYRLLDKLKALRDRELTKDKWKEYVAKHPSDDLATDEWEDAYLPADEDDLAELPLPRLPLLMDLSHITRRIAAQRSRFIVFGTDPAWLAEEFAKPDSCIQAIIINGAFCGQIEFSLGTVALQNPLFIPISMAWAVK